MRVLRYLLRQWVFFWLLSLGGAGGLLVIYRVLENLRYLGGERSLVWSLGAILRLVFWTLGVSLYPLLALASLLAWLLLVERLRSRNEDVALCSLGGNPRWIWGAGLLGALFSGALQLFWGNSFLPPASRQLRYLEGVELRQLHKRGLWGGRRIWYQGKGTIYRIGGVSRDGRRFGPVTLWRFGADGAVRQRIDADKMLPLEPGRWLLHDVWLRAVGPGRALQTRHSRRLSLSLPERPRVFWTLSGVPSEFSLGELRQVIALRRQQGAEYRSFQIALWQRWFFPLLGPLLVLWAAALTLAGPPPRQRRRASVGLALSLGLALAFGAWFLATTTAALAQGGRLSPFVGATLPLALLAMSLPLILLLQHLRR